MAISKHIEETIQAARRFAALRENFAPSELLLFLHGLDVDLSDSALVRAMAVLRSDCMRLSTEDSLLWTMRTRRRQTVLENPPPEGFDAYITTAAGVEIRDAVRSKGEIQENNGPLEGDALQQAVTTLESTGQSAATFDRLAELRGMISQELKIGKIEERTVVETFGRQEEIEKICNWHRASKSGTKVKAIHVRGGPGSGKSHLMDHAIITIRETESPVIVKLDFGKSGFEYHTAYGFFSEVSRQVADAIPESAPGFRTLRRSYISEISESANLALTVGQPIEFVSAIAVAMKPVKRALLVILDSIDTLQDHGETRLEGVFKYLDLLRDAGIKNITVLMAGQNSCPAYNSGRIADVIELEGLSENAAEEMLRLSGLAEDVRPAIIRIAKGNPFLLRLAAEVMTDRNDVSLMSPGTNGGGNFTERLLKTLLSSLHGPLRSIANAALFFDRIDRDVIAEIIAPSVDLDRSELEPDNIMEQFSNISWLFQPEGSWLRIRSDVRAAFLGNHYKRSRELAIRINTAAAEFFHTSDTGSELYHRLQLTRFGSALPSVSRERGSALTAEQLDELPRVARNAVRQSCGRRSENRYRENSPETAHDIKVALRDLEISLQSCDLVEAALIFSRIPAGSFKSIPDRQLEMSFYWLTGRWSKARNIWRNPEFGNAVNVADSSYYFLHRILLEMRAEFGFRRLVGNLRQAEIFDNAVEIHQASPRTGLRGGALDFALLAACDDISKLPKSVELAVASVSPWLSFRDRLDIKPWADQSARIVSRCGGTGFVRPDAEGEGNVSNHTHHQVFSVLNPYAIPMRHLAEFGPEGTLCDYLNRLRSNLLQSSDGSSLERLLSDFAGTVDLLTGRELTTHWSGAFSYFHPIPDFPRLARSAQRWQRTMGGIWSFPGRPPKNWRGSGHIDLGTNYELEDYPKGSQAVEAAWRKLEVALAPHRPSGTRQAVKARVSNPLRQLTAQLEKGDNIHDVAVAFQASGVAGAIAVPLSIIANRSQPT